MIDAHPPGLVLFFLVLLVVQVVLFPLLVSEPNTVTIPLSGR